MLTVIDRGRNRGLLVANDDPVEAKLVRKAKDDRWVATLEPEMLAGLRGERVRDIDLSVRRIGVQVIRAPWSVFIDVLHDSQFGWRRRTRVVPSQLNWAQPWAIADYFAAGKELSEAGQWGFKFSRRGGEYNRTITLAADERSIAEIMSTEIAEQRSFDASVTERLMASVRPDAVVTMFTFPREVRTACEQYLLHFVDFLADLGVVAEADLKHAAGSVLFTVAPTDRMDALDRISQALDLYIKLPSAKLVGLAGNDVEISARLLEMNVQFLKSQLSAAEAKSMFLGATVEAQRLTIDTLRVLAAGQIAQFAETVAAGRDDETVLGGLVAITKYKGEGFEVDLPELYRRLRQFFSRD